MYLINPEPVNVFSAHLACKRKSFVSGAFFNCLHWKEKSDEI